MGFARRLDAKGAVTRLLLTAAGAITLRVPHWSSPTTSCDWMVQGSHDFIPPNHRTTTKMFRPCGPWTRWCSRLAPLSTPLHRYVSTSRSANYDYAEV
jgi:hypothetical protein